MSEAAAWTLERMDRTAVLTFTRAPHNLLSFVLLEELDAVLLELSADARVTVVVLTGGVPGYFVGHADLGDVERLVSDAPGPGSPDDWTTTLGRLSSMPQPVVAAVNGQAWGGGCELALAAQLRVAASSASFAFVEVAAGAIPGAGGTQRLPRLIGPSAAARMVLSGDLVTAARAQALGLGRRRAARRRLPCCDPGLGRTHRRTPPSRGHHRQARTRRRTEYGAGQRPRLRTAAVPRTAAITRDASALPG